MNVSIENKKTTIIAWLEDLNTIFVKGDIQGDLDEWKLFQIGHNEKEVNIEAVEHHGRIRITTEDTLQAGILYIVENSYGHQARVLSGKAVRTETFDKLYAYDGDDLGALCGKSHTYAAVWAPTAENVELLLYEKGVTAPVETRHMIRTEKGVWRVKLVGDYHLQRYTYRVNVNGEQHETSDPYGSSASVNGRCSIMIDWERLTEPVHAPASSFHHPVDAIIYEAHVRDFTSHLYSNADNKGKYKSWTENDTKTPDGLSTGLSYLKELGITHVQLLPVQDFGSVDETKEPPAYNWGYDAVHHFTPEGSYATDADDGPARITELQSAVSALHLAGIRVTMDVVYNHFYIREFSSLEKLVPGYYFRYEESGIPSDGTGVGNDTASERKMMKKYIIDSLKHWVKHYSVDGFRFDLMGIHDVETMQRIEKELLAINPSLMLYGEGWNMPTSLPHHQKAVIEQSGRMNKIGFFNDRFRDLIKGSHMNREEVGFIHGNAAKTAELPYYLKGSVISQNYRDPLFDDPGKSINYVECHDNYTLWDHLEFKSSHIKKEARMKMHRLATAVVLLAQGVPFLHAGQEFYRTKFGVENSYNSPLWINQLDWKKRGQYQNYVNYVKGLIAVRRKYSCFRMQTKEEIGNRFVLLEAPENVVAFYFKKKADDEQQVMVVLNASETEKQLDLPGSGPLQVLVDGESANLIPLKTINSHAINIQSMTAMVLLQ
ncbi:type I pullulanase [Alteribacillus sp. HJP-4]|uniref:type I pullulanase n=1 Tax=Alteribacillus sp. HJP-4 TaxID=2775394 RepID=UPI0035CCCD1E